MDCLSTLVTSTYREGSEWNRDYRLSQYVSKESYDRLKQDLSADAIVYRIPLGGSYSDYKAKSRRMVRRSNASLTEAQAHNVLWTGLDQDSLPAFQACVRAASYGLFLHAGKATEQHVELLLSYRPTPEGDEDLKLKWSGPTDGLDLPSTIDAHGENTIIIDRPSSDEEERLIAANGEGGISTGAVHITAYPPPPPELPVPAWAQAQVYLGGGSHTLGEGYELRNIRYWPLDQPHTHAFRFDVFGSNGLLRSDVPYEGRNQPQWTKKTIEIDGYVLEFGFSHWNDYMGTLHYRMY